MDTASVDKMFSRIGARLKVTNRQVNRFRTASALSLDVQNDRKGEFFEIAQQPDAEAEIAVLDVQPADRHLRSRAPRGPTSPGCGRSHLVQRVLWMGR